MGVKTFLSSKVGSNWYNALFSNFQNSIWRHSSMSVIILIDFEIDTPSFCAHYFFRATIAIRKSFQLCGYALIYFKYSTRRYKLFQIQPQWRPIPISKDHLTENDPHPLFIVHLTQGRS